MRRALWGLAFSAVVLAAAPAGTAQAEDAPVARLTFSGNDGISLDESYAYTSTTAGTSLVVTRSANGQEITAVVGGYSEIPHSQQGSGGADWWTLRLSARTGQVLGVGTYSNAGRWPSATKPLLDLSGNGRGCGDAPSAFTVHELTVTDGAVVRLNASFELQCASWPGPTRGRLLVGVPDMPELPAFSSPATLIATTSVALVRWIPTRSLLKVRVPKFRATVRGSITCARGPWTVTGMLSQNNDLGHADGDFRVQGTCTGVPQSWSVTVQSWHEAPYQPGSAGVSLKSYAGADSYYFVGAVVTTKHTDVTIGQATLKAGVATATSPAGGRVPQLPDPAPSPAVAAGGTAARFGWSVGAAAARAGSASRAAG